MEDIQLNNGVKMPVAGYEAAKKAIDNSLRNLQTDYLDLYLIHRPFGDYYGAWRAMEEAVDAGKLRAIGLSNFESERLEEVMTAANIKPAVCTAWSEIRQEQCSDHPALAYSGGEHHLPENNQSATHEGQL